MRAQWILVLLIPCCLLSCNGSSQPELAHITQIGPDMVEPGDILQILGRGFVEGPAEVTLSGDLKPLGLGAPRKQRIVLPGTATSENRVEVPLTARLMKQFVREPSRFFGGVEVTFPVVQGAVRIFAVHKGVAMDFRPGGAGVVKAASREREAARFLGTLGLRVLDSREVDGLVVGEVREGSPAHHAGMAFGDRLLSIDGVAVGSTAELAGVLPAETHRFEVVSRKGALRELEIRAPSDRCVDRDELAALLLSSVAFGFFIALVAPKKRRWEIFRSRHSDPFTKAVGFGTVSLLLLLVPAATAVLRDGFVVSLGLLGLSAMGLAMTYALSAPRGRSVAAALFGLAVVPALLVVSGALSSAAGLGDIVHHQKSVPYGIHAVAGPFPLLVVMSSLFLIWPVQPAKPSWQRLSAMATWISAAPAAAAVTACGLGGWLVPFAPESGSGALFALGCVLFLAKTWIVILTARWLVSFEVQDRRATRRVRRPWTPFGVVLLSTPSALGWEILDLPRTVDTAGQVLATAMLIALATALAVLSLRSVLVGQSLPKNTRTAGLESPPAPAG